MENNQQNKEHRFLWGFIAGFGVMALVALVFWGGNFVIKQVKSMTRVQKNEEDTKAEFLEKFVDKYYLEEKDERAWEEGAYKGMIKSLGDPYSEYYSAEEYDDMMVSMTGDYAGVGALLQKDTTTGVVTITKVYKGTPAEEAGLQKGDIILYADEFSSLDEELDKFVTHIRGDAGTTVKLTILRGEEERQFIIKRAKISAPSVEYQMLSDNIGYIEVSQFLEKTDEDFIDAYEDLKSQGMEKVVVDLRGNGGGLVDSVTNLLDYLLPEGVLVYTENKDGGQYKYNSDAKSQDLPMVVLVDANTASASEIFAGAVRDYDYAKLIGTKTFGKGIVQSTVQLYDGSAVKLTTDYYYTPNGECIHGEGIEPDIEIEYEPLEEGEKYEVEKDNQVIRAIEELNK